MSSTSYFYNMIRIRGAQAGIPNNNSRSPSSSSLDGMLTVAKGDSFYDHSLSSYRWPMHARQAILVMKVRIIYFKKRSNAVPLSSQSITIFGVYVFSAVKLSDFAH